MAKGCVNFLPARMDKRVTIQSVAQASDGQGGWTETWSDVATVWAFIRPTKGFERFQAAQFQTPATHKVTIRYRAGVTTKHRLLYGARVFEVKDVVNPNEADAFLEMLCVDRGVTVALASDAFLAQAGGGLLLQAGGYLSPQ